MACFTLEWALLGSNMAIKKEFRILTNGSSYSGLLWPVEDYSALEGPGLGQRGWGSEFEKVDLLKVR
jgi:hypothetical protein